MPENNGNSLENRTTQELEFQQYVKKQFELLFARIDQLDEKVDSVRTEMIERFLQLSRQMRDLESRLTFTPGSTRT